MIERLKGDVNMKIFEKKIKQYLLDNPHKLAILMTPGTTALIILANNSHPMYYRRRIHEGGSGGRKEAAQRRQAKISGKRFERN
jgi:hypothetical protein